jgi:hypothetical protein
MRGLYWQCEAGAVRDFPAKYGVLAAVHPYSDGDN